jgi:cell division protein FtsI/penicillin-binding protein 2
MNGVLSGGTANIVGDNLRNNSIRLDEFIAKTGTAESSSQQHNTSSSIIVANQKVTIGIMLKGKIPSNSQNLAAKNLMSLIIPILKEYRVL